MAGNENTVQLELKVSNSEVILATQSLKGLSKEADAAAKAVGNFTSGMGQANTESQTARKAKVSN
jgi:hypothetical protein